MGATKEAASTGTDSTTMTWRSTTSSGTEAMIAISTGFRKAFMSSTKRRRRTKMEASTDRMFFELAVLMEAMSMHLCKTMMRERSMQCNSVKEMYRKLNNYFNN